MIKKIDYKTIKINKNTIVFPVRFDNLLLFKKYQLIIASLGQIDSDIEYQTKEFDYIKYKNIHCYDMEGNLKWVFPKGITGMEKMDEDTVSLYDGSWDNYVKVSTGEVIRKIWVK
jgi:hypothetical protein